jgi:hypothetical protein
VSGFTEEWLAEHQARMAALKSAPSPEPSLAASPESSALQASGAVRAAYSRGSMGRRADLGGLFVRSSWEANVARYLNFLKDRGEIFGWAYEPDTFWFEAIKRGVRSYKPDFKVWKREGADAYYIEVKGWMDAKSKTKLKRMKKYHPTVRVDVLDAKQYRALAQTVGHLLPNWERAAIDGGRRDTLL